MKTYFSSKTLIALAVAVAAAAGYKSLANEQPIPPPASESALPDSIPPGSPVAQVVKLVQAGVDVGVIQNYISNCPTAFNLDADKIIALTDAGLPADMVNAMFAHDKNFLASLASAAPPVAVAPASPSTAPVAGAETAPPPAPASPPAEVNITYINETLAPYGSWVEVDGYGRCWRPNVVVYDTGWRPYCDRGRWVYTDCGWYWNSDYSWGITFHYGRWFNDPHHGWCWWPDTVWAPSWVTWRSCNDYCGWAPLPPYTVYTPGIGFSYRGATVALSFSFGLTPSCYTFVSPGNFCEPHPRYHCLPPQQVTQIYNQTTVINNYNSHNRTIVNNGVSVTTIGEARRHPIQAVPVGSMANPGRRGWHSQSVDAPGRHFGADNADGSDNRQLASAGSHRDTSVQNNNNTDVNRRSPFNPPSRTQTTTPPADRHGQRGSGITARDANTSQATQQPTQTVSAPTNRRDQRESLILAGNGNNRTQTSPTVAGQVNGSASTTVPVRNSSQNGSLGAGGERAQTVRQFAPPVAATPPVVRPTMTDNRMPVVAQQPSTRSDVRSQQRQVNPQPVYTAPSVPVERPQRIESRQNFAQATPRNFVSPMPSMSSSAQNQSFNGANAYQGWAMRNH